MTQGPTVGVDFGTTNSCIAVWRNGAPEIVEIGDQRVLPSVVTFIDATSDPAVGVTAINEGKRLPDFRFDRIKLLMGKPWRDHEDTGRKTVESDPDDQARTWTYLQGPDRVYSPSEVAAFLFMTMFAAVEAKLGVAPGGVVVTVPDGFNELQRRAIRKAAELAGIAPDRIHLLEEPTAAALAHGYTLSKFARLVVYDLGGGTFDVSFIQASKKGVEVIATNGDSRLGGTNFDERAKGEMIRRYFEKTGVNLADRPKTPARILEACEDAKKSLSNNDKAAVYVDFVDNIGPNVGHLDEVLTRSEFEALTHDLVRETIDICREAMTLKGIAKTDIDDVILVGGMTHVPMVREAVEQFFGKKPRVDINPKEVVALGAAIKGALIDGVISDVKFMNRVSHSLGLEMVGNRFVEAIPKGTPFPPDGKAIQKTLVLTNCRDDQTKLSVFVRQGGDIRADRNDILGHAHFAVEPRPVDEHALSVMFSIDAAGMIQVITGEGDVIYDGAVL